jgi:hypothetical protein
MNGYYYKWQYGGNEEVINQEFLATDPEVPALPNFLRRGGLERGPLSLARTTEELLE